MVALHQPSAIVLCFYLALSLVEGSYPNKLIVEDLHVVPDSECVARSDEGDWIEWHYIGTLIDGTEFARGDYSANLGYGEVIKGVDVGMRGLCAGDKRRLIMHADWAYGERGVAPNIPGRATLAFVVEVYRVVKAESKADL